MSIHPLFETVSELLPHEKPMILIDRVSDWGDSFLEAVIEHHSPSLFADENGYVPGWVGIEYMAQAVAAWVGIRSKRNGGPIQIGFLLGTRKYQSHCASFAPGKAVTVRIDKLMLDDNSLGLFECKIFADRILASAQIKAIQPDNAETMLREKRLS